jgi:hypothetical protein
MMVSLRSLVGLLMGVAVIGSAAQAHAGFEIGGRLGYGIPLGKSVDSDNSNLSNTVSGMIPLQLDVGYRIIPSIMVGGYLQYGIGFVGSSGKALCDQSGASCGVHDVRFGAQFQYHVSPGGGVDPWFGAGLGYEWLTTSLNSSTVHGWEFLSLQGGVDLSPIAMLGVGPFVSLSFAQYSKLSSDAASGDISNKSLHEWLILGVRGTFSL